ncbi:MAG: LamG domain-containing protein [Verrucomicrobia bacterium]|nr:MAG: LamG domain-containing protein [Verrucomicrobiota bacterium]
MNTNMRKPTVPLKLSAFPPQPALNRFAAFQSFITLFVAVLASLITVSVSAQTNPQPSFLTNGLVAYYPFNGNANDESGNGHHGNSLGAISVNDRNGSISKAFRFDGTGYVSINHNTQLDFGEQTPMSVSFWMLREPGEAHVLGKRAGQDDCSFQVHSGAFHGSAWYSGLNFNLPESSNKWIHVAYAFDGNRMAAFIDGNLQISQSGRSLGPKSAVPIMIGKLNYGAPFKGSLDDIRFYNRALSDTEVKALYDYESKPPDNNFITNGLVAYYPFNGNAEDASGNGNAGLQVNTLPIADRFNKKSSAFAFNGTSSKVTIKNKIINMGLDGYAINFWFSPYSLNQKLNKTSENGGGVLFNNISGLGIEVSFTTYTAPQYAQYGIDDGISGAWDMSMNQNYYGAKNNYAINKWYMATLVKNGGEYTFFINSDIQDRQSNSKSYSLKDGFIIGSSFWNEYFEGAIDDVRIYNRALSSNEVAQLYAYESQPQSAWIVVQISPTFQNPVWTSVATNTVPSSGPRQFYQMRASVVESAVDLKNPIWTPVATNNLPSEPQKFYRLVAQ